MRPGLGLGVVGSGLCDMCEEISQGHLSSVTSNTYNVVVVSLLSCLIYNLLLKVVAFFSI